MMNITAEIPADAPARDMLLLAAFGEGRFRKTAEKLRAGKLPAEGLAFSLKDAEAKLIGTLRFWNIRAGNAGEALLLGPIAIAEHRRSEGFGASLIRHGLAQAKRLNHHAVLLVGDAPYYQRFGFSGGLTQGLHLPGPVDRARFMGLELRPGALANASGMLQATGRTDHLLEDAVLDALCAIS
jgi:predicted N-acetyltransferase YhbS